MSILIFVIIHLVALFNAPLLLLVTIPLHILFEVVYSQRRKVSNKTHALCPDCKGIVRRDACVCMHCRCILVPTLITA